MYSDATIEEINEAVEKSWKAYPIYRKCSLRQRSNFLRTIAQLLDSSKDDLIAIANMETNLPVVRLEGELKRTMFQLTNYADACEKGDWLELRIDLAVSNKKPPSPDIRKTLVPIGPVAVFGAANFPFAYSTAGGDTACALAAGCSVVVKAHPAHAQTSETVANVIQNAAKDCGIPNDVFIHLHGVSNEVGRTLVEHPYIKAVGFTGSLAGGRQLFDWASQRKEPIPVFAEMSSTNPVFLMPDKMKTDAASIAKMYAGSITQGVGQFCTNPGLIIGLDNSDLKIFEETLESEIKNIPPATMLHPGICENYLSKKDQVLSELEVKILAESSISPKENQGAPVVATTHAEAFIKNPKLHQEVFGPFSLIIKCKDEKQMIAVAQSMDGQLTSTMMGTDKDFLENENLIEAIKNLCGRFILNGVPTGVEVCLSMQHGGPYPSTTDSRFTSVGADGIKRFARPIAFQNWSNNLLPEELKNENPLKLWRTINNHLTKESV